MAKRDNRKGKAVARRAKSTPGKPVAKAAPTAPPAAPLELKWSAETIETRAIDLLRPWDLNPRHHPQEQLDKLAARIRAVGFTSPLLIHKDGRIIQGHGRWQASRLAGLARVPVIVAPDYWTDDDCQAQVLADNQLALLSSWDDEVMRTAAAKLMASGRSLEDLGFAAVDINQFIAEAQKTEGLTDPDEPVPEPPAIPVSRPGDVWLLGRHRLTCGDSTKPEDVTRVLAGAKPHLMVTDPPYGVKYDANWRNEAVQKSAASGMPSAIGGGGGQ